MNCIHVLSTVFISIPIVRFSFKKELSLFVQKYIHHIPFFHEKSVEMFMASLLILLTYKLSFSSMNPVKNRSLHSVICVIMVSFHTFKGTLSPGTAKTPPAQRGGNWKILGSWKQSKKRVKIFIANFQKSHPKHMSYHWAFFSDISLPVLPVLYNNI